MCVLCTRVCMCACVCVRACEYDEPFSYLISSYSSSRICSLGNRSHRSMFPFPLYRDIWTFRLFIQSVACRRRGRRNMASFVETEAKRTNVEREPGEKWIDRFFSPSFFFSLIFSYSSFFPTIFRGQDITFSFGEEQKRPRITKGKAIRARSKDSKSKPATGLWQDPNRILFAAPEFDSRRGCCPPGTNEIQSFARRASFPFSHAFHERETDPRNVDARRSFDDLFYSFRFAFTIAFENDFIR